MIFYGGILNTDLTETETCPAESSTAITAKNSLAFSFQLQMWNRGFFFMKMFCLFVWSLSSHSWLFHSYGDVTISGEGLQILTYARHSWSLSHTHCDTGLPFIKIISEDPWHSTCCRAFCSGAVTTCFHDLGLSRPGIEPRSPAC